MKNILPLLLLTLFLATACEDVVQVDLRTEEQRIAIDAFIDNTQAPQVRIARTLAYNDQSAPEAIHGATVTLTDNAVPQRRINLLEVDGIYTSPEAFVGEVGRVYTLSVQVDGKTYTAIDSLKPVSPIDSVKVTKNWPTDTHYSVFIYSQETPGGGDNYRWLIYHNDQLLYHPDFIAISDDQYVDGQYIEHAQILNGEFAGFARDVKILDGTRIRVVQMSISRACMRYLQQLQTVTRGQGLFSPPPANVPTNFDNGAVGFFRASALSSSPTLVAPVL